MSKLGPSAVVAESGVAGGQFDVMVSIAVLELGPVVKLLSSASLVEGGTEVALRIASWQPRRPTQPREFMVHWRHGGPGVVKGVAGLPDDMVAALRSGLKPADRTP